MARRFGNRVPLHRKAIEMAMSKEERAARRAAEAAEQHAKLEAQLQATIDLVTAMFWNLECGENLTNEQVAACRYDNVLGVLWYRVWDYAEYQSRTHRLNRIAHDDGTSLYLQYESRRCSEDCAAMFTDHKPTVYFSDQVRAIALEGHPKARAMRRRHAARKRA
jgi:hypothetical protein